MEPNLLAKISIRVVSLYVISKGFMMLPYIFTFFLKSETSNPIDGLEIFITVASIIAPMIFGLGLWFLAPAISKLMVGEPNPKLVQVKLTASQLHTIAISTAGLIIVVLTVPSLVYKLHQFFTNPDMFQFDQKKYEIWFASDILAELLKLLFGLSLMLGSPFFVRLLHKFRTIGIK